MTDLHPTHLMVRFNGGEDHETLAVELIMDPPEGACTQSPSLTATLDGVDLGEPYTGDIHGYGVIPPYGCLRQRWTTARSAAPRGPGNKVLTITSGSSSLRMTIPEPLTHRRLAPAVALEGVVQRSQTFTVQLAAAAAGGTLMDAGIAAWSPEGSTTGDHQRIEQQNTLSSASPTSAVWVTVPADLSPGTWRLFVWAPVQIPVQCPVQTCDVSTFARFSRTVTVQ